MNKDALLSKLPIKKLTLGLLATATLMSNPTLCWSTTAPSLTHKGATALDINKLQKQLTKFRKLSPNVNGLLNALNSPGMQQLVKFVKDQQENDSEPLGTEVKDKVLNAISSNSLSLNQQDLGMARYVAADTNGTKLILAVAKYPELSLVLTELTAPAFTTAITNIQTGKATQGDIELFNNTLSKSFIQSAFKEHSSDLVKVMGADSSQLISLLKTAVEADNPYTAIEEALTQPKPQSENSVTGVHPNINEGLKFSQNSPVMKKILSAIRKTQKTVGSDALYQADNLNNIKNKIQSNQMGLSAAESGLANTFAKDEAGLKLMITMAKHPQLDSVLIKLTAPEFLKAVKDKQTGNATSEQLKILQDTLTKPSVAFSLKHAPKNVFNALFGTDSKPLFTVFNEVTAEQQASSSTTTSSRNNSSRDVNTGSNTAATNSSNQDLYSSESVEKVAKTLDDVEKGAARTSVDPEQVRLAIIWFDGLFGDGLFYSNDTKRFEMQVEEAWGSSNQQVDNQGANATHFNNVEASETPLPTGDCIDMQ